MYVTRKGLSREAIALLTVSLSTEKESRLNAYPKREGLVH